MKIEEFLKHLQCVHPGKKGRWVARCPAHEDHHPSLSVSAGQTGILVKCWTGCTLETITSSMGLRINDLFYSTKDPRAQRVSPMVRAPRSGIAIQLETHADKLQGRGLEVLELATKLNVIAWSDSELDIAMDAVGAAYADFDRAKLLLGVADSLRIDCFYQKKNEGSRAA